jgi:hypothetical protein
VRSASHARQFSQDTIPLHEIEHVGKGEDDLADLFNILDMDADGLLSLMELQDGLAMYGLTPLQTRALFFGSLPEDMPLPLDLQMQFADFKKHLAAPELRQQAQSVIILKTAADGFNSGAKYHLQLIETLSEVGGGDIDHWIDEIKDRVAVAVEKHRMLAAWQAFQARLAASYNSHLTQLLVGMLIVGNFVLTATRMQIHPEEGSEMERHFEMGDLVFTLIFTFELCINLIAHWWAPFWMDGWNIFDFVVVSVCLLSITFSSFDVFKSLRLLRPFRLLRSTLEL